MRAAGPVLGPALDPHRYAGDRWASNRLLYLDNLKVVLIAMIIAIHAVLGYAGLIEVWTYSDVREVTLSPITEGALFVLIGPFGLFMIPLLFLVAGLLTPGSLQRKGTARFVRDRLLRLGVPFAAYVALVQPALVYAVEHPLGAASGSYWSEFLGAERVLDTGPLWFVGVLLIFSLAYAGWTRARPPAGAGSASAPITATRLLVLAAAIAPASFLIRLVYPYGGDSGFTDLNLWEWPGCAALFALGIASARTAWLRAVPDPLYRQCRAATLAAVGGFAAFAAFGALSGGITEQSWSGGWQWPAFVFAGLESVLTVFGPVWLLGVAQRGLDRDLRWAGPAVRRSAYGAFILQTMFLLGLAVALRPVPVPAEVKGLVVAAGGVAASFGLARLLITRVPGAARIL